MAFQSEVEYGLDNFGKAKVLNTSESVATVLLHLLFLRPGQLPSQPHIGIDISKYLYQFEEDISVDQLRNEITAQAPYMLQYIDTGKMQMFVHGEGEESYLYIFIPLLIDPSQAVAIGFKKSKRSNIVTFNYSVTENILA